MNRVGSEEELCLQLAQWLRMQYPDVPAHFDFGSGTKLSMSQARRQKALNVPGWPDLFIACSAFWPDMVDVAHGLFVELKREGTRLKKRDGSWASPHIEEQAAVLEHLQDLGYIAQFAVGFAEAQDIISSYLYAGRAARRAA